MFNASNAEFWTASLIWSLFASLLVMPGLVIAYHAFLKREVQEPSISLREQPLFIENEVKEGLWPDFENTDPSEEKTRS
jgi:hypothetical protein